MARRKWLCLLALLVVCQAVPGSASLSDFCALNTLDDNSIASTSANCVVSNFEELQSMVNSIQDAWEEKSTGEEPMPSGTWGAVSNLTIELEGNTYRMKESIKFHVAPEHGFHVHLVSAGSGKPIIDCGDTPLPAFIFSAASNVTFRGLSFQYCAPAMFVVIKDPQPLLPVHVVVENCQFVGNSGNVSAGAALFVNLTSLQITNSDFHDNSCPSDYSSGAVGLINIDTARLYNCSFRNNSSPGYYSAGALKADSFQLAVVEHCIFERNLALGNKSAPGVLMSQTAFRAGSSAQVSDSQFLSNNGTKSQALGSLMISSISRAEVSRTVFRGNNGFGDLSRGAMSLLHVTTSLVHQVLFEDNSADCDSDNLRHPTLSSLAGLTFTGSTTMCGGGAITIWQSPAFISNCTFIRNIAKTSYAAGGALLIMATMDVHILNSTFDSNRGVAGGAIMMWSGSSVIIDAPFFSPFKPCEGDLAIKEMHQLWPILYDLSPVEPGKSIFRNNLGLAMGGAITVSDASLSIGFFQDFKCTGYPDNSGLTVFINNGAMSGGAILILRPLFVHIVYCQFERNYAFISDAAVAGGLATVGCGLGNGGALCWAITGLSRGTTHAIAASSFINNRAVYGGAMYITADEVTCTRPETCNLMFITGLQACNPQFLTVYQPNMGNVMLPTSKVNITNNTAQGGAGGALYFEHTGLTHIQCGDNNGIWDLDAVGLRSKCTENSAIYPRLEACFDWSGNKAIAGGFGDILAGTPLTFQAEVVHPSQLSSYKSGEPLPILLKSYDMFGNEHAVALRNLAKAADTLYTVSALRGNTVLGAINIKTTPGRLPVNMSTLTFEATPGPVELHIEASIQKIVCPSDAECITNTTEGAVNAIIAPALGQFNSNPFSSQISECPYPRACKKEDRTLALAEYQNELSLGDPWDPSALESYDAEYYYSLQCLKGYTGPLCAVCSKGYGGLGSGKCMKCSTKGAVITMVTLLYIVTLIPLTWSMRVAMACIYDAALRVKEFSAPRRVKLQEQAAVMKILVSYLQVLGMLVWIDVSSSSSLGEDSVTLIYSIQEIADRLVYIGDNVVIVQCAIDGDSLLKAVYSSVIAFLVPVAGMLVLILMFGFPDFWSLVRHSISLVCFPVWKHASSTAKMMEPEFVGRLRSKISTLSNRRLGPYQEKSVDSDLPSAFASPTASFVMNRGIPTVPIKGDQGQSNRTDSLSMSTSFSRFRGGR
eukprot:gene28186-31284_t